MKKISPKSLEYMNFDLFKEQSIYYKQATKEMIKAIIRKTPKDILIEVLKSEKIILQDWEAKGNKYKLKQNEA
jgi:hypothetical protein